MTQAKLGTALFASGAINTWRVETIADVLLRHDTMHKGDDVQQGLILHCLAHKTYFLQPELRHPGNYKVRLPFFWLCMYDRITASCVARHACALPKVDVSATLITTDVPVHWFHWPDLLPARLTRSHQVSRPN